MPPTNHDPAPRLIDAAVASLVLLSLGGIFLGVVGLVFDKGVAWAVPIVVGLISLLGSFVQVTLQRENSAALARLSENLKRDSMQYERKLNAFAEVTRAFLGLIVWAQAVIRAHETIEGLGGKPVDPALGLFFDQAKESLDRFNSNCAVLCLLADDAVIEVLDSISSTLAELDVVYLKHQLEAPEREKLFQDRPSELPDLRAALVEFRRCNDGLRKLAKEHLRT